MEWAVQGSHHPWKSSKGVQVVARPSLTPCSRRGEERRAEGKVGKLVGQMETG